MKSNKSREMRVGGLLVIGFVIIFAAIFTVGNREGLFNQKYDLKAKFSDVRGLTIGAPVRLGGVKVGSVESINFSPGGVDKSIIVDMEISKESFVRIKQDSDARLGSQGLLGDRTIDLSVGSPAAPGLKQGEFVRSIEATQLDDLISKGGDALTNIELTAQNAKEIAWKINHGEGSMAQIINDPRLYTSLDSLLNMWSDITLKINSGRGNISRVVNDSAFYNNLSGSLGELRTFMASINAGQGTLGRMTKDDYLYNHIDSLLTSINSTLSGINNGEGTAGKLVSNDDLYNKMNRTVDDLDKLIADIKENPKRYLKISLF